jgi:hypothetical protein
MATRHAGRPTQVDMVHALATWSPGSTAPRYDPSIAPLHIPGDATSPCRTPTTTFAAVHAAGCA